MSQLASGRQVSVNASVMRGEQGQRPARSLAQGASDLQGVIASQDVRGSRGFFPDCLRSVIATAGQSAYDEHLDQNRNNHTPDVLLAAKKKRIEAEEAKTKQIEALDIDGMNELIET